jgi:SAM-dependent methyltransferase
MRANEQQGSAVRWGPLFDARAEDWAQTWEGPHGWGQPVYTHVLKSAQVGPGSRLLDCGCGAGRFPRLAADRGASVAGLDAASRLIEIARRRVPDGDFRVGDLESLPWPDGQFDLVTGLSAFQFADDKVRALTEALWSNPSAPRQSRASREHRGMRGRPLSGPRVPWCPEPR